MIRLKYQDGSEIRIEPGVVKSTRKTTGSANIDAAFDGIESFILALSCLESLQLTTGQLQQALTEAEDAIMNNMEV